MGSETKICPYCGEEININARKCKHCHTWLEGDESPSRIPPAKRCPFCNWLIPRDSITCPKCGEYLVETRDNDSNSGCGCRSGCGCILVILIVVLFILLPIVQALFPGIAFVADFILYFLIGVLLAIIFFRD